MMTDKRLSEDSLDEAVFTRFFPLATRKEELPELLAKSTALRRQLFVAAVPSIVSFILGVSLATFVFWSGWVDFLLRITGMPLSYDYLRTGGIVAFLLLSPFIVAGITIIAIDIRSDRFARKFRTGVEQIYGKMKNFGFIAAKCPLGVSTINFDEAGFASLIGEEAQPVEARIELAHALGAIRVLLKTDPTGAYWVSHEYCTAINLHFYKSLVIKNREIRQDS